MRPALRLVTIGLAVTTVGVMGITALFAAVPEQPDDLAQSSAAPAAAPPPGPVPTTSAPAGPGGFTASPLDVNGQVKETAVRFVERVGTWRTETDPTTRVVDAGYPPELAASAGPLLDVPAQESDVTLIYPQYGGLTETAASVMVLVRQTLHTGRGDPP